MKTAILLACLLTSLQLFATTHVVTDSGDTGSGTLRDYLENISTAGDTILFDPSITTVLISGNTAIQINHAITILGGVNNVQIDGNFNSRIFVCYATGQSAVVLKNLTLKNAVYSGTEANGGGAMRVFGMGANLFLESCFFETNLSTTSGGALTTQGGLEILNCTFENNAAADFGGALYLPNGTQTAQIAGCNFGFNNSANYSGGAISTLNRSLVVSESRFYQNESFLNGGAIYFSNTSTPANHFITITGSLFFSNEAVYRGGAVLVDKAVAPSFISTSTFGENLAATNQGSAVFFNETEVFDVEHCTFNANTDDCIAWKGLSASAPLNLKMNICSSPLTLMQGYVISTGYNAFAVAPTSSPTVSFTSGVGDILGGTFVLEPLGLLPYGNGMEAYSLPCGSNLIDFAPPTFSVSQAEDQRQMPRLSGSGYDIGAVEIYKHLITVPEDSSYCDTTNSIDLLVLMDAPTITFYDNNWLALQSGSNQVLNLTGPYDGYVYLEVPDEINCSTTVDSFLVQFDPISPTLDFNQTTGIISCSSASSYQWFHNGFSINGATNQTHDVTLTGAGSYYVVVTNSFGCNYISDTISVLDLGVTETATDELTFYPNPTSDELHLTSNSVIHEVLVYSPTGTLVKSIRVETGITKQLTVKLPETSGTYLLKIVSADSQQIIRAVKK